MNCGNVAARPPPAGSARVRFGGRPKHADDDDGTMREHNRNRNPERNRDPMRSAEAMANLARLLADDTRATFCLALLDGRAWTLTELARHAGVAASTASEHTSRLIAGGLLAEERQGRHRYVRIATPDVANLIETITSTAGRRRPDVSSLAGATRRQALTRARTCYDHLAGRLGVAISDAMTERALVSWERGLTVTPDGQRWLANLGLSADRPRPTRRPVLRSCLDWTERRPHLGGAVAAALCRHAFDASWIGRRRVESRGHRDRRRPRRPRTASRDRPSTRSTVATPVADVYVRQGGEGHALRRRGQAARWSPPIARDGLRRHTPSIPGAAAFAVPPRPDLSRPVPRSGSTTEPAPYRARISQRRSSTVSEPTHRPGGEIAVDEGVGNGPSARPEIRPPTPGRSPRSEASMSAQEWFATSTATLVSAPRDRSHRAPSSGWKPVSTRSAA